MAESVLFARHRGIAMEHPCRLAVECAHPRFAFRARGCTIVLTVDNGYE